MMVLWELFNLLRQALGEGVSPDDLKKVIKEEMTRNADQRVRNKYIR